MSSSNQSSKPIKGHLNKIHQIRANVGIGIVARTFLIIAILLIMSLMAWLYIVLQAQQSTRAEQLAERAATAMNISQKSLAYVPEENLSSLVIRLATPGDTQVFPRQSNDLTTPLPNNEFWQMVETHLGQLLDAPDQFIASSVNGEPGLWLSLKAHDQYFWLLVRHDYQSLSILSNEGLSWLILALVLAALTSFAAWKIVGEPLTHLSKSAKLVARGETPPKLPTDRGPSEIVELFDSFNNMVHDLRQTDSDREIMLAGISHDLRTPLARMRLEIELSEINDSSKEAIDEDIAQIDHCISQLMEYARPTGTLPSEAINISTIIEELCHRDQVYTEFRGGKLSYEVKPNLHAKIKEVDLVRVVSNLIENARRYGKDENDQLAISVKVYATQNSIVIDVADHGLGIHTDDRERILRPFARGETARTDASGAGLGLAISQRLLKHANGSLTLLENEPQGLLCRIEIPKDGN